MVTVKLFGILRLDSGIKELQAEAARVKDLYPLIITESARRSPGANISMDDIKGCLVTVNGKRATAGARLHDGDLVYFVPAVAGG